MGLGRIYVKLDESEEFTFDNWVAGVKNGRSYCGDGLSHLLDFKVNDVALGEPGSKDQVSQLDLEKPGKVKVTFDAAAFLEPKPTPYTESIRNRRLDEKPYWNVERCRIGDSRKVPVEVIVNGEVVATRELVCDGSTVPMEFDVEIPHSSWVAVRILPSCHTNPIFVEVAGQPIRASRRSAEWCVKAVENCWESKQRLISNADKKQAAPAYEKAKAIYRSIAEESVAD